MSPILLAYSIILWTAPIPLLVGVRRRVAQHPDSYPSLEPQTKYPLRLMSLSIMSSLDMA